jgi:Na+/melibiose symporter-like transporter
MILALVVMLVSFVISLIGWFLVREKHIVEQDPEDKVKFSDFFELMRTNKLMMLNFFKNIFTGFIWTFLFAAPMYYVKYAYAANLTTGEVNMEYYATLSMIVSLMMMFPLILGTVFANPVLKAFKGNFLKMHIFDLGLQGASGLLMFIMQILGLLRQSPVFFFIPMFMMAFAVGIDFVPGSNLSMEIMDYTIYKTGKDRSALTGVLEKFLEKAQSAVSSAIVGGVLIAITIGKLNPFIGFIVGIKAFTAAVFGGIGSIPGALLGGLLLGIIEILSKAYISTNLSDVIVFGVLIFILLVKPTGLLGKNIREKV